MHRVGLASTVLMLVLALVLACTPAADDVGEAETETMSEETGDGDGDVCYDIQGDVSLLVDVIDCGFTSPCDEVAFMMMGDLCSQATYDPAAAACIVEQLAAGTQAIHRVTDCPGGQYSTSWSLQVFGDGTVLYVETENLDLVSDGHATWRALPDAAYFQACQTDTPQALVDCLEGILEQECQLGEPSCP